jgi:CheY-like chemotaxis protein
MNWLWNQELGARPSGEAAHLSALARAKCDWRSEVGMNSSVLVVEDDPHVRMMLDELLQDQGLDVWSVADDLTAYQVLGQEARRFSVLLTDINLGADTDGFDVARRARSLNAEIEVIFITGYPVDPDRYAAEGGVLLTKPLDLRALLDRIRIAAAGKVEPH